MKTYHAKPQDVTCAWWLLDMDKNSVPLGRLATRVAQILQGKHKPTYTPSVDMGDAVVVVNVAAVTLKGPNKAKKEMHHYSGFPGGLKTRTYADMLVRSPEDIFRLAVRRMLPKGPLGRKMLKKLKIYRGPEHQHTAQQPQPLTV